MKFYSVVLCTRLYSFCLLFTTLLRFASRFACFLSRSYQAFCLRFSVLFSLRGGLLSTDKRMSVRVCIRLIRFRARVRMQAESRGCTFRRKKTRLASAWLDKKQIRRRHCTYLGSTRFATSRALDGTWKGRCECVSWLDKQGPFLYSLGLDEVPAHQRVDERLVDDSGQPV